MSTSETLAAIFGVLVLAYFIVALVFTHKYYARRHGFRLNYFRGNNFSIGLMVASFIGAMWPIIIFVPSLRYPQLCTCPEHVFQRQEVRRETERYQAALEEEQGKGW